MDNKIFITLGSQKFQFNRLLKAVDELCEKGTVDAEDAMLFRVLVGLYSCVYVAQKNAKKIAYTSISAAIINITVDLILINKIQVFAASVSTLVAFLSMFVIRYIDVNKTVHMKIRKPIIVGSVLIGGMLIGTYYCGNKIIQFVALCITAIYAMLTNVDMLKSGVNLVKSRLGK